jgi:enoyl-CoA hydratase/carnithine racemase
MADNFLFEKTGPLCTITFNRPERRNCLDEAIVLEFERLVHRVRDDHEVRVMIVAGAGSAFCAGADLSVFKNASDPAERRRIAREQGSRLPRLIGRVFDAISNMDAISIGAINGYAVGGGWSFALAFDFAIAVREAEFWVPEVELGMPFRGYPADVLAARLGPWMAKEAIILCRRFTAEELHAARILNRVVERAELMPAAREIADRVLRMPAEAVAASKRGINSVFFGPRPF